MNMKGQFEVGQKFRIDDGNWGLSDVTIHQIVTDPKKIYSICPVLPVPPMLVQFLIKPDRYPDDPPFIDELSADEFVSYIGDAQPERPER